MISYRNKAKVSRGKNIKSRHFSLFKKFSIITECLPYHELHRHAFPHCKKNFKKSVALSVGRHIKINHPIFALNFKAKISTRKLV